MLGDRSLSFVLRQTLELDNYRAVYRQRRVIAAPPDFLARYLLGHGEYPIRCEMRTPTGPVAATAYSQHDVITVNEIFCRLDYELPAGATRVIDIGSNIGISALYFLTRAPEVFCHLFEPDPRNLERLRANLAPFEGRFAVTAAAVADRSGRARFGREPSGRYGGLDLQLAGEIEVDCLHINDVLRDALADGGEIDLLKIDTEGMENRTVQAIDRDLLERIHVICFETRTPVNPAPERFELHFATDTARLVNRVGAASPLQAPGVR
jgi:FkbM family methyltransferase